MNQETGELRLLESLAAEELAENGGEFIPVPEEHSKEVEELMSDNRRVDFHGRSPLSKWAKDIKGCNRAEKRKEAKRIRKELRRIT